MNPEEARSSLDDIHRLQERTRDEYVRHSFARSYMLLSALGLFVAVASLDFPQPWQIVVFLVGEGILVASALVQRRRAPVQRKPTVPEVMFQVAMGVILIGAFIAYSIASALGAFAFDLPVQHTITGAALALTALAVAVPVRRLFGSIVRSG
ncbi:hypothetical protein E1281_02350 [Actinomadura sp. KC345]|uniref:hypothetical protein n=1 Tax=Actinomadura sp. KC345 TaxID=2530371 RepID=UPI00104F03A7|nr:hypothetical protein [Actinomadura sp. KC345]TDC58199.1 hypothetical protein E1281_02350 [Actinomadura sp. KC345]